MVGRDREPLGDLVDSPRFAEPSLAALDSPHRVVARATLETW